eukprot:355066-Chlamydomonas_euryale.AAC.19
MAHLVRKGSTLQAPGRLGQIQWYTYTDALLPHATAWTEFACNGSKVKTKTMCMLGAAGAEGQNGAPVILQEKPIIGAWRRPACGDRVGPESPEESCSHGLAPDELACNLYASGTESGMQAH